MIQRIYIKDFILIKELELPLHEGFTAITGETGAGKSILIGAIGLILGNRADFRTIRTGATKAIIEAECLLKGIEGMEQLFDELELDYEPVSILRRELTSSGKSRAFINDTPVTTAVMKSIGERLVDIHSQHHNMLIGNAEYQMSVLDTLADNHPLLVEYEALYQNYLQAKRELKAEEKRAEEQRKEQDYISFQYKQLEEAKLQPGEMTELEERLSVAQHSLEIREALEGITGFVEDYPEQEGVLTQIGRVCRQLQHIVSHFTQGEELYNRLEGVKIELNELAREAEGLTGQLNTDPQELERMEERIDLLQGLLHKHSLTDTDELIALRNRYEQELEQIENSDHHLEQLRKELEEKHDTALTQAKLVSERRQKAGEKILPQLHDLMKELGIAGATFKVQLTHLDSLTPSGTDEVEFLFATNKKTTLQPISEIASGGEISRFMLALKCILSEHTVLPTAIFDEIDSGVSGEIAEKLGQVMARMGTHMQVLSITHLPQIAALAEHQLLVEKVEDEQEYLTHIRAVTGEERVREIAAMLSGTERTDAAMENARALLGLAKKK